MPKRNWKLYLYCTIVIGVCCSVIEYTIWANTDIDGFISYDQILDRQELEMLEPKFASGAVIGFNRDRQGIEYRVPTLGQIPLFPFYKKYYSQHVPPVLLIEPD